MSSKKEYRVLSWDPGSKRHPLPPLFIGERLRTSKVKLKKGMLLRYLAHSATVRIDDIQDYPRKDDGFKSYKKLLLTHIHQNGEEGKQFESATVNQYLSIKLANVKKEHQGLFYGDQTVEGMIVDGAFQPHKDYLVDWKTLFVEHLKLKERYAYSRKHPADQNMPFMLRVIIDEIGTPVFNEFIRQYFVGQQDPDEAFALAHKAMRQVGPLSMHHPEKSFAEHMLYTTIHMSEEFYHAVKTVVYNQ